MYVFISASRVSILNYRYTTTLQNVTIHYLLETSNYITHRHTCKNIIYMDSLNRCHLYYNSGRSSVCLFVSELLRDGWTDLLHFLGKDRYNARLTSYLYFITLMQRSRSPEVIEIIYLFVSM